MNKKKHKRQKKESIQISSEEEREGQKYRILSHAENLAEELNLRLILEADGGQIFYVESVAVTEICFPESKKQKKRETMGFWRSLYTYIRRFLSRLTGNAQEQNNHGNGHYI